ncbi:YhcN/YlaJ family sporulation lipoprotein [Paenibacillus sp. GCM10012307]|uniref:YhcN/YlaJ family sporulation lipoprotein n=1 Tax=Paenibacillus roseus TaxID=2798579 RepID=A0A934MT19_9BACL|nr:YhcN/YlaJ family sporulation lipoprotein [Paenibacillus roseus]MBJ6363804.1 YhcN/YlaJ family sporulation lipoprotein [Paenibacillus roseus]
MIKRGLTALTACVALTAMIAGCASNQGDVGNKSFKQNSVLRDANGNRIITNKRFANDQANEMNRVNGRRLNSNNVIGAHQNYKIDVSESAANRVVSLKEVKSAYVMLGDKNAYVAVNLHDSRAPGTTRTHSAGTDVAITDHLKQKIAAEVKKVKPDTQQVFVSTNPDFVGRMTSYMDEARAGHPIQGLIAEFNAMVERVFPERTQAR